MEKEKKILALDAMGVVYVNEDDIEELLIPFLKRRYGNIDTEKLRDLYYNQVSFGKISSKEFFRVLTVPDIENEYLDECLKNWVFLWYFFIKKLEQSFKLIIHRNLRGHNKTIISFIQYKK